jgi:tyrosyl-tRNA synthetase
VARLKRGVAEGRNPRDVKFELGVELVGRFHDQATAERAKANFIARFQKGAMPDDMPEVRLTASSGSLPVWAALKESGLTESSSEARRMLKQGAVRVDGERVSDPGLEFVRGQALVLQVGKRKFAKVVVC